MQCLPFCCGSAPSVYHGYTISYCLISLDVIVTWFCPIRLLACFAFSFLSGLRRRRIPEMNPENLGNIPSGALQLEQNEWINWRVVHAKADVCLVAKTHSKADVWIRRRLVFPTESTSLSRRSFYFSSSCCLSALTEWRISPETSIIFPPHVGGRHELRPEFQPVQSLWTRCVASQHFLTRFTRRQHPHCWCNGSVRGSLRSSGCSWCSHLQWASNLVLTLCCGIAAPTPNISQHTS